jgi:hypothetical protein
VTLGRLSRFALRFVFNAVIFLAFESGRVLDPGSFDGVGGIAGITVLTSIASQGVQYIAVILFNRGVGDLNRNVMCAFAANVLVTAAATTGLHMIKLVLVVSSLILGASIFGIGLISDIRSWLYPRKGIGIFFGTFSPFHVTHVAIVKRAIEERQLSRIIIHSAVVPRLDALALQRGEIHVARIENDLHVLERTRKADLNEHYLPTGNRFYPPETRKLMIDLSLEEAGLKGRVDALWLPEVYEQRGFHGVIGEIKRMYPRHGTPRASRQRPRRNVGQGHLRRIRVDLSLSCPAARRRVGHRDSAGAKGMTAAAVAAVLNAFGAEEKWVDIRGRRYSVKDGLVNLKA